MADQSHLDRSKSSVIEEMDDRKFTINFGPQHPAAHGVLRLVLDLDGDLKTTADQTEIARINQRFFADGSPAVPDERRWSGLKSAGTHRLTPKSVLILRAGDKGGPTAADIAVFEEAAGGIPVSVVAVAVAVAVVAVGSLLCRLAR
jgi:hypothetical protein